MTAVLTRHRLQPTHSRRRVEPSNQRLDIQGVRMFAMMTIFAFHLCGWPRGGFAMVDVFFVVSGFLITGNLLRMAERRGNVSFKRFYWNRVRRIIPAATVVLILTYVASVLVFRPFRAHEVGVDALYAFIFMSNWWFAAEKTNYFAGGDAASPIQHYWTLSVEEQFYFVWPALVFIIGVVVARRAWTHGRRMALSGAVMGSVIAASLLWALYETETLPTRAYFDTLARVWELGAGALLATAVGLLARMPVSLKPWLSWIGLGLVTASLFLITEDSVGFPAPWALLPVSGAALIIASGVKGEPSQWILQNRASVYVGNISYSLYLVHWPVIVILAALMPRGVYFYIAAVLLTFGLAVASFHFIEDPLRYADRGKVSRLFRKLRKGGLAPKRSTQFAAIAAMSLLTLGLTAYAVHPVASVPSPPEVVASAHTDPQQTQSESGPPGSALDQLQQQIKLALSAAEWPQLDPSMESVQAATNKNAPDLDQWYSPELAQCISISDPDVCTWGSPSALVRVMLVGDSVALSYANSLRDIALHSYGRIQLRVEAKTGCHLMVNYLDDIDGDARDACVAKRQDTIADINNSRPDVVIISGAYMDDPQAGGPDQWAEYRHQVVDQFKDSARKLVWLAAPPDDKNIADCYSVASSAPTDCISRVTDKWLNVAQTEQTVAGSLGGVWIDSRPWFCTDGMCPAFVGSTPTKLDERHMTRAYAQKISPVIAESLAAAGVI